MDSSTLPTDNSSPKRPPIYIGKKDCELIAKQLINIVQKSIAAAKQEVFYTKSNKAYINQMSQNEYEDECSLRIRVMDYALNSYLETVHENFSKGFINYYDFLEFLGKEQVQDDGYCLGNPCDWVPVIQNEHIFKYTNNDNGAPINSEPKTKKKMRGIR